MDNREQDVDQKPKQEKVLARLQCDARMTDQKEFAYKTIVFMFVWSYCTYALFCISNWSPSMLEFEQKYFLYAMLLFGIMLGTSSVTFMQVPSSRSGVLGYTIIILLIISALFGYQCLFSYLISKYPISHYLLVNMLMAFFFLEFLHSVMWGFFSNRPIEFWIYIGLAIVGIAFVPLLITLDGEYDTEVTTGQLVLFTTLLIMLLVVITADGLLLSSGSKSETLRMDEYPFSVYLCMINVIFFPLTSILVVCGCIIGLFLH